MSIKKLSFIIFIMSIFFTCSSGATRTPPLTGYWYQKAIPNYSSAYTTACNELRGTKFELTHKTTSPYNTAVSFAREYIFAKHGIYPLACNATLESETVGDLTTWSDWNLYSLTIANPGNPRGMVMYVKCDLPDGQTDNVYVPVHPYYGECEGDGCLDICHADVPGRELNPLEDWPDWLPDKWKEWLEDRMDLLIKMGHIGIGKIQFGSDPLNPYEYYLLEVLDEDVVIQINTLKEYQAKTEYWNAGFGGINDVPAGQKNISIEHSAIIYEIAAEQMDYCPQYSRWAMESRPGTPEFKKVYDVEKENWNTQLVFACAIWRCDTFVNYAYSALGVELPLTSRFDGKLLPLFTYASMPYYRPSININNQPNKNIKKTQLPEITLTYENINSEILNFDSFPFTIQKMINEKNISPLERTAFTLTEIQKNKDDIWLIQNITDPFISPKYDLSEQLDSVLIFFKNYHDPKIRRNILRGLAITYTYHLAGKSDKKSLEKIIKIQNIFSEQLKNPQKEVILTAIGYLPTIFPYEQTKKLLDSVNIKKLTSAEKTEIIRKQVWIAFNYLRDSEEKWQNFVKNLSAEQARQYAQVMASYLSNKKNVNSFNDVQKTIIKDYMELNKPLQFKNGDAYDTYAMNKWYKALVNLSIDTHNSREEMILCYVNQHNHLLELSAYLKQYSFNFKNNTTSPCYQQLKNKLNTALKYNDIKSDQHFIVGVLNTLNMYEQQAGH